MLHVPLTSTTEEDGIDIRPHKIFLIMYFDMIDAHLSMKAQIEYQLCDNQVKFMFLVPRTQRILKGRIIKGAQNLEV